MLPGHTFSGRVFAGRPTRAVLRFLDWVAEHALAAEKIAAHHRTGRRGEKEAYFYLRKLGYTIVALGTSGRRAARERLT